MKILETGETTCEGYDEGFLAWCEQMMKERAAIEHYEGFKAFYESSILMHRICCVKGCEAVVARDRMTAKAGAFERAIRSHGGEHDHDGYGYTPEGIVCYTCVHCADIYRRGIEKGSICLKCKYQDRDKGIDLWQFAEDRFYEPAALITSTEQTDNHESPVIRK